MVICEGGETIVENGYVIHAFKTTGVSTLKVVEGGLVEVLVVAGGGGGGNANTTTSEGGGGGAGGLIFNSNFYITAPANISVTVGAGGAAGTNGGNSIFSTLTAIGGGAGGSSAVGGNGGSGGGGSWAAAGGTGTTGQGKNGGGGVYYQNLHTSYAACGGGGGGAGTVGGFAGNINNVSFGGDGLYYPQFSNVGGSPPGWFAAGGQGGTVNVVNKKYRSYGGGGYSCDVNNTNSPSYPGIPNTGGGGGGRLITGTAPGANGGSGIVIIRYKNYISQTTTTYFSDLKLAFGGTTPIYFSAYYANSANKYTSNIRNIPNTGNTITMTQFRSNDNTIDFKLYSYYGTINSNCISLAVDSYSNIFFTDNTNYISKIDTSKNLNSTFYNVGFPNSKIYILSNVLYLAYRYIDSTPVYWGTTEMANRYIRIKKLTLDASGNVSSDVLFVDKLHHSSIPGGDTAFWPCVDPDAIIVNPNGNVYIAVRTNYWWDQQDILKVAADGTKSIIYHYNGDANQYNTVVYSLAPSNDSIGFYTIHQNNFNYMNDAGTITSLYNMGNSNCIIVRYLNSKMILFNRTSLIAIIYDFNSSSIMASETVSLYNVDFIAMCRSSISDVFIFNVKSQRIIVRKCPNDGSSSNRAALSGFHLAQLNTSLNLGLTNGNYWIKGEKMTSALQMFVNFTADGGGYDFYLMTTGTTSVNYIYQLTGAETLGLDIFYPRSKAHWAAIYDYVINTKASTIATCVPVVGKVYRINGIGNYSNIVMRNPRYFSGGAPDWMVPDGGQWFIRDTGYSEPNGDYYGYAYLTLYSLASDGTTTFNDGNANYYTGTTIICSTNFKGSIFDVSTNNGSTSAKAALSGWHLAKYSKTYNLNLPSGTYWIKSPKMTSAIQMYVDMTREGGGYDFYRLTNATNRYLVTTVDNVASNLGLDIFYPRSKDHWAAIYNFVVTVSSSTIANDVKTVGAVHRNGGGNYSTSVMRNSRYYLTGTVDWRVPDDGNWFIRDTTFTEPSGDYTANSFLGLNTLTSDGSVTSFNDGNNPNYYTGTTVICSTNVKGFSYFD